MKQTQAQKAKQLLNKDGLNCKVKKSIKKKIEILEENKIIKK